MKKITNEQFLQSLRQINACTDSKDWVVSNKGTFSQMWRDTDRGDWMVWYLLRNYSELGITREEVVEVGRECEKLPINIFKHEKTSGDSLIMSKEEIDKSNILYKKTLKQCADIFRAHFPQFSSEEL